MGPCTQLHRSVLMGAVSALLLLLFVGNSFAQDFRDRQSRAGLTIGPSFVSGASMILEPGEGWKLNPIFAWRTGVHTSYPLTEVITAGLEIGFESRGTQLHVHNNSDLYLNNRLLYFSLYPNFSFSAFNIGFNFGFPLSASQSEANGTSRSLTDTEDLPVLLEPRIGVVVPLVDVKEGWLSLVLGGGFAFSELIDYPGPVDLVGDWRSVSGHLGVRFEFGIPGTEREK